MPFPGPYTLPVAAKSIAIQGQPGSFSHLTCSAIFADAAVHHFDTFEAPFESVVAKKSQLAVIPIQNSIAGHVPYVHRLIRNKRLHIIGEYFLPIEMCLLTLPGAPLSQIKTVHSHIHALNQCKGFLEQHRDRFSASVHADTAGAARMIADLGDPAQASISPAFAAHLYGLHIAKRAIQDAQKNVTRFLVLSPDPFVHWRQFDMHYVTAMILKPLRSVEWPLHEIVKVFKEHGIRHTTPLEFEGPNFRIEEFYIEAFAHEKDLAMEMVLDVLRPYKKGGGIVSSRTITGCFPAHHFARFGRAPLAFDAPGAAQNQRLKLTFQNLQSPNSFWKEPEGRGGIYIRAAKALGAAALTKTKLTEDNRLHATFTTHMREDAAAELLMNEFLRERGWRLRTEDTRHLILDHGAPVLSL